MKPRDFLIVLAVVAVVALILHNGKTEQQPPAAAPTVAAVQTPAPVDTSTPIDDPWKVPDPPENTEAIRARGRQLYKTNCASCHGPTARGDGDAGPALEPPPTNLTDISNYKYGSDGKAIYRTTMYGIDGTGMAPWDGLLAPHDVWAIAFYLETIQQKRGAGSYQWHVDSPRTSPETDGMTPPPKDAKPTAFPLDDHLEVPGHPR